MRHYMLFRIAVGVLIVGIITLGILNYQGQIDDKIANIGFGIAAGLLAVVAAFAIRPPGDEVAEVLPAAIAQLPDNVLKDLKDKSIQSTELKTFIEVTSNEIFLRKMESLLHKAIDSRYVGSELERLITELVEVERQLNNVGLVPTTKPIPKLLQVSLDEIKAAKDPTNKIDQVLKSLNYPRWARIVVIYGLRVAQNLPGIGIFVK